MSKLILLRHGQSAWNEKNLFTGWVDIPLSESGVREAMQAGALLSEQPIDMIFTSTLIRAQMTLALALLHHHSKKVPVFVHPNEQPRASWEQIHSKEAKEQTIPVFQAWELNERMYGDLQGLNKAETIRTFGEERVHQWRRSFDVVPPHGESLEMTAKRTIPYFCNTIEPLLAQGKNILICAHGNSLRAIIMHWERLTPKEIIHRELATGHPLIYTQRT